MTVWKKLTEGGNLKSKLDWLAVEGKSHRSRLLLSTAKTGYSASKARWSMTPIGTLRFAKHRMKADELRATALGGAHGAISSTLRLSTKKSTDFAELSLAPSSILESMAYERIQFSSSSDLTSLEHKPQPYPQLDQASPTRLLTLRRRLNRQPSITPLVFQHRAISAG